MPLDEPEEPLLPEEPIESLELDPDEPLVPVSVRLSQPTVAKLSAARIRRILDVLLIAFILVPFVNVNCHLRSCCRT